MRKEGGSCLVIGSNGMLGTDLIRIFRKSGTETTGLDRPDIDIRNVDSVRSAFSRYEPRVAINVAALTNVDGCETNVAEAFSVNGEGPGNIATVASEHGAFFVHISTDYVFDGRKGSPYREDDPMSPLGVYARSKAQGEERIRFALPDGHCIVRTQWLFGLNGNNFVETILKLAGCRQTLTVVDDQHGTPTYTPDLAVALKHLSELRYCGTIHVTNSGRTTWYDFAREILQKAGVTGVRVEPIPSTKLDRPAPRPAYAVLDNSRFVELTGTGLRSWQEALAAYLDARKNRA